MPGEVERHCLVAQLPVAHPLPIGVLGRNHRQSGGFTLSAVEASLDTVDDKGGVQGFADQGGRGKLARQLVPAVARDRHEWDT